MNTDETKIFGPASPSWTRILGGVIVAVNIFFLVFMVATEEFSSSMWIPIAGMLAGAALGWMLAVSRIQLKISPHNVRVGLWPLSSAVIPAEEIMEFTIIPNVAPQSFGGVGLRKIRDKSGKPVRGYLWGAGPGLEMVASDGARYTVVFHGDDGYEQIAEAAALLDQLMAETD